MALPKGRKIVVGGQSYQWLIKDSRSKRQRHLTWTPRAMILTLQSESGSAQQFVCQSRKWTPQDDYDEFEGGAATHHRVAFGPKQVREVIEAGLVKCTLTNWEVTPRR